MRLVQVQPRASQNRRKHYVLRWLSGMFVVILAVGIMMYFRPLPAATVTLRLPPLPEPASPSISWPSTGEAAFGAVGYDLTLSSAQPRPVSTASMAKVITALCVLEKHPLKVGEMGPSITMTVDDVARMQQQLDQGGSNLRISQGEVLTQYQMLQALLLPSANNIADSLAVWAFGSLEQYQKFAQQYVKQHNMPQTQVGPDASGFETSTVSTTSDLTTLGKLALSNPVIMQIASTKSATFETAGTVYNTNKLLDGGVLSGLKTGMNNGNTGGFLFTSLIKKADRDIPVAGVVVNAGSSASAVAQAEQLVESISDDFEVITFASAKQVIGIAKTAWGTTAPITTTRDISLVRWRANKLWHTEQIAQTDATKAGQIGSLTVRTNGAKVMSPLVISKPAAPPSTLWRLTHLR